MPQAALVGDFGSSHNGFPATPITTGSSTVKIDNKSAARQGDQLAPHNKPNHSPHPRQIKTSSSTVMIDGVPAARVGDAVDCGGIIVGSSSVYIG